jgi:hypothetical protein
MTAAPEPGVSPLAPEDPRHVALADLVGRAAAMLARLAQLYEAASQAAVGDLRETLETLAREQERLAAEVAHVTGRLDAFPAAPPVAGPVPPRWGLVLGQAFEWERALELLGRELAVLAGETALGRLGARLAAAAARDGREIRRLYLRYS